MSGAQTLLRALDILEAFTSDRPSLSLAEISQQVGLKTPTTHRLLKALASRGMVVTDASRRYSLGPAAMRLASVIMHREDDLVSVATPVLDRLRALIGETVSIHCLLGEARICVAEFVSPEPIRMESGVGQVYPLYAGAAGKVMLAWLPERVESLPDRLPMVGPSTITRTLDLDRELEGIRSRGYATSDSEVVPGAASLAVPVFGGNGALIAAINVAGPASRWNRSKISRYRSQVLEETDHLMQQLASSGPPGRDGGGRPASARGRR